MINRTYNTKQVFKNSLTGEVKTIYYFLLTNDIRSAGIIVNQDIINGECTIKIAKHNYMWGPNTFVATTTNLSKKEQVDVLYDWFMSLEISELLKYLKSV